VTAWSCGGRLMEEISSLMVIGPPTQQPPPELRDETSSHALVHVPSVPPMEVDSSHELPLPSDMMARFEALSRAFKQEVEGLIDQDQATSRVTTEQLHEQISDLEQKLKAQDDEAALGAARIYTHLSEHRAKWLPHVFGRLDSPEAREVSVADFRDIVESFVQMSESDTDPELDAAKAEISKLREQLAARDDAIATLQSDLREARVLKTQEERDLVEFRSIREKESELQDAQLRIGELQSKIDEFHATQNILLARASQSEAALSEKSRKIVSLMKDVEEQTEQSRLLANENNTLRLHLGKDSDYLKVVKPPADPLSYTSSVGKLSEEFENEERRMRDELSMTQLKFPGLVNGADNCRNWCGAQIARQCALYRSFLHLFQDYREDAPEGIGIKFVSKAREVDEAWLQREEEMKDSDAAFHENEKTLTKQWEDKRLELTAERDTKIKQLLEQADRSQTKAEKQLLMQQAKLFGQRMDTQIERVWEDQKAQRDERWAKHNQAKIESRQKFKDESLSVQQQAEGLASATGRFQDMAQARLAGPEDTWVRNVEKVSLISASAIKGQSLYDCLKASGLQHASLPSKGSQYSGISQVAEAVEELLCLRAKGRRDAREALDDQSMQQLRQCVERFVQHESMQQQQRRALPCQEEVEPVPEYSQALIMKSLLQSMQQRVVADTIRRQFNDFLLVLRIACLAAVHLLPPKLAANFQGRDAKLDLPPIPKELFEDLAPNEVRGSATSNSILESSVQTSQGCDIQDVEAEGRFLYDALVRRFLEKVLTPLHTSQREELLALKRGHAKSVRKVLQHLCQLEGGVVDKCVEMDVEEYKAQIRTKLVADCEYHVCEERRHLEEQVDDEVNMHVNRYRQQLANEERASLRDRRKWLTEKLVLLQSQGASAPGDKALMQHLRTELRACELRFEQRDRELLGWDGCGEDPLEAPQSQLVKIRDSSSSPTPRSLCSSPPSPRRALDDLQLCNPTPPTVAPPSSRRPYAKPQHDMALPIGRPSGARSPSVVDLPSPTNSCSGGGGDFAGAGPPCFGADELCPKRSSVPASQQSARNAGSQLSPRNTVSQPPPRNVLSLESPSFGADGGAGFGRHPSFGDEKETLHKNAFPLYEWPFDATDLMCETSPKMTVEPRKQKSAHSLPASKLPEMLPPLKPPLMRPSMNDLEHDFGSYSSGISIGTASSLKSPRLMPQLLPPMLSPRGYH